MKYEVRAETNITFDFEVEAKSDIDAKNQVKKLLPHIEHGKLENQPVTVRCKKGQMLRSLFIMDVVCEDINELD